MSNRLNLPHAVKPELTCSEHYILHECSQLRDEIWTRVHDQRATERYMLLALAVIYSFLSLHRGDSVSEEIRLLMACAWYAPPLLAFLAAARWAENVRLIHQIADYTQAREQELLGQRGGWETYLKKLNNGKGPSVLLSGHYIFFWLFLIFSTMTIAAYQQSLFDTTWRLSAALLIGVLAAIGTRVVIARPWITLVPAIFQHGHSSGDAQPPPLSP
jgi:hypothetical protein